jgi:hypothetical protein
MELKKSIVSENLNNENLEEDLQAWLIEPRKAFEAMFGDESFKKEVASPNKEGSNQDKSKERRQEEDSLSCDGDKEDLNEKEEIRLNGNGRETKK